MGQITEDVQCGFQCSWCGVCFQGEHGHLVACRCCYQDRHEELNRGRAKGEKRKKPELPCATIEEF